MISGVFGLPPRPQQQQLQHPSSSPHEPSQKRPKSSTPPPPPPTSTTTQSKPQSYLVKKYRPQSQHRPIDAFQRYTKSHRMTDATFATIEQADTQTPRCYISSRHRKPRLFPVIAS